VRWIPAETTSTRWPASGLRAPNAGDQVVLPASPSLPNNRTSRRSVRSRAREISDKRPLDSHAATPLVELVPVWVRLQHGKGADSGIRITNRGEQAI
jgi:hypothetical protein